MIITHTQLHEQLHSIDKRARDTLARMPVAVAVLPFQVLRLSGCRFRSLLAAASQAKPGTVLVAGGSEWVWGGWGEGRKVLLLFWHLSLSVCVCENK